MNTYLRPLTLGEILDETAQLYRTHFLLLAGIASVYAGGLLLLSLVEIGIQEAFRASHTANQLIWITILSVLVMWPLVVILGGFAVAANNRAVSWIHLGVPVTIGSAYRGILPRWGRYLWLMVITTFIVWIPFGVLYAGYTAFIVFYARPKGIFLQTAQRDPQALIVFGLVTAGFGLLLLGAVVYAVLMGLRFSLAVPACVIEDLKAPQAIRRSVQLSKGSRGRILLLGLLVVAIQMGLGLVTQGFFVFATFRHHGDLSVGMRVLQQLVAFCSNTFVGPIYATGFTLFYYDQRVRKEGYDIEWMMQAAGLEPSPDRPVNGGSILPADPAARIGEPLA